MEAPSVEIALSFLEDDHEDIEDRPCIKCKGVFPENHLRRAQHKGEYVELCNYVDESGEAVGCYVYYKGKDSTRPVGKGRSQCHRFMPQISDTKKNGL